MSGHLNMLVGHRVAQYVAYSDRPVSNYTENAIHEIFLIATIFTIKYTVYEKN
jgi:hypothetical protein